MHRIPTVRNPKQVKPRDILCRVHIFRIKDEIMRIAWQKGSIKFKEDEIQVFPDLCRQTKDRRRMLRPLLDHILLKGATYRWVYPISLTIKKGDNIFNLYDPEQLPEVFQFLGSEAFEVPNWIDLPRGAERRSATQMYQRYQKKGPAQSSK